MSKKTTEVLAGTMGHFWTNLSEFPLLDPSWPGHAQRDEGRFAIRTIKRPDEALGDRAAAIPQAVIGVTEYGGILGFDVRGVPENSVWGGPSISVRSYPCRGLAVGVLPHDLQSTSIKGMTTHFHGLARWSGVTGSTTEHEKNADGTKYLLTYKTLDVKPIGTRLNRGQRIEIGLAWSANHRQMDQFSATTPLTFSVICDKPSSWYDLINPSIQFQNLISLAYDNFVPCVDGLLDLDYQPGEDKQRRAGLWSASLMDVPTGVPAVSTDLEIPSFTLGSLSGIEGVKRWLRLSQQFPRASGPLISRYRNGSSNVEIELINIAVAIEYWVAVCRHNGRPAWSKKRGNPPQKLASHVGAEFNNFVGDSSKWGELFWKRYNDLKHNPNVQYDGLELRTLMRGGRILLMCALLNRAATTKAPSRAILQSSRHYNTSEDLKDLVCNP